MKNFNLPSFGAGVGLRHTHFDEIIRNRPACNWFEIIAEDFIGVGGYTGESLEKIREHYRIIAHGVCMAIGSTDPLDMQYLKNLSAFLKKIDSPWASDHLCFTMVDHTNLNDLIPLPFTSEAVKHVVERVKIVQQVLERPFLLENVTRYITVSNREMEEWEFLTQITEQANCGILLDITNIYLNSQFHKFDPEQYINSIPLERVGQIHLAGFEIHEDGSYIDSHDAPVPEPVWKLFKSVIAQIGQTSVLVEWDKELPPFSRLIEEARMADAAMLEITAAQEAA